MIVLPCCSFSFFLSKNYHHNCNYNGVDICVQFCSVRFYICVCCGMHACRWQALKCSSSGQLFFMFLICLNDDVHVNHFPFASGFSITYRQFITCLGIFVLVVFVFLFCFCGEFMCSLQIGGSNLMLDDISMRRRKIYGSTISRYIETLYRGL